MERGLFGYDEDFRVIEPPDLRDSIRRKSQQITANHQLSRLPVEVSSLLGILAPAKPLKPAQFEFTNTPSYGDERDSLRSSLRKLSLNSDLHPPNDHLIQK